LHSSPKNRLDPCSASLVFLQYAVKALSLSQKN
jgi:hypothetical protein